MFYVKCFYIISTHLVTFTIARMPVILFFKNEVVEIQIMLNLLAAGIKSSSCYAIAYSEVYLACKHCLDNICFLTF